MMKNIYSQVRKKCPECKKISVVEWEQAFGMRLTKTGDDGKEYYTAKCPLCKYEWSVKK